MISVNIRPPEPAVSNGLNSGTSSVQTGLRQKTIDILKKSLPPLVALASFAGSRELLLRNAENSPYYLPLLGSSVMLHTAFGSYIFFRQKSDKIPLELPTIEEEIIEKKMTGDEREHRIRSASHVLQSLEKKMACAQQEMKKESDNPTFYFAPAPRFPATQGKVGSFSFGACHYIGRRPTMEDEGLAKSVEFLIQGQKINGELFGIFDGHGGDFVSQFIKTNLPHALKKEIESRNQNGLTKEGIWNALKMTFVSLSDQLKKDGQGDHVGSTAVIALVLDGALWVASVGDSRAILSAGGKPIQLSDDMKPGTLENPSQVTQRIINRGGHPFGNPPRVNGMLATGGAIGDHAIAGISARPSITCVNLADLPPNTHLIIGCDGIFDVASTRQIAAGIHRYSFLNDLNLARAVVGSAYHAYSMDNLSTLVVRLKN